MPDEAKQLTRTFTFTLTESQTNMILGALGELPFKSSADVINALHRQANAQLAREALDKKDES